MIINNYLIVLEVDKENKLQSIYFEKTAGALRKEKICGRPAWGCFRPLPQAGP